MEDRIFHGLQVILGALIGAPPPTSIYQVDAIANIWNIIESLNHFICWLPCPSGPTGTHLRDVQRCPHRKHHLPQHPLSCPPLLGVHCLDQPQAFTHHYLPCQPFKLLLGALTSAMQFSKVPSEPRQPMPLPLPSLVQLLPRASPPCAHCRQAAIS